MAQLPDPTAEGDLARTPFAHALLYCHQRALSGTLVVWPEDAQATPGQDRIRLEKGIPVAARLVHKAVALDRGLLPLFARRSGAYAFYADLDLVGEGEAVRTGRVDPWTLIAASLRGPSRDDVVDHVLAGLSAGAVRVRAGADLRRFELLPKEQAFLDVVRAAPATIEELSSQSELGAPMARRLLYLFAITKVIEPYKASRPSGRPALPLPPERGASARPPARASAAPTPGAPSTGAGGASSRPRSVRPSAPGRPAAQRAKLEIERPPPPPAGLSPAHAAMWGEIAERADTIDKQNYFEMLGVSKDAGPDAFRKAYFAQVKKWHPDRVPAELADIKPWAERIFHHLTAAHDTLCDEKKRGRYQSIVADGGGTPESDRKLSAILQAAMDHQKAEVLLRRRDVAGALALLVGALELSPDDGDIQASYAWALFLQPGKPEVERMSTAIRRAVELCPKSDRAHYYHGMILRRAGKETEALAEFEKAAQLNPKNLDAVRETRLSKMRGTGGAPAAPVEKPGAGGVLSKLFGASKKEK